MKTSGSARTFEGSTAVDRLYRSSYAIPSSELLSQLVMVNESAYILEMIFRQLDILRNLVY